MDNAVFVEVVMLLGTAVLAVAVFRRLRMPSALGYLLVGALVGPHAFGLVPDTEHTRILAEFGIVFLLFTIGLNYSLPQILAMRGVVFGLGSAQVGLTTLLVTAAAWWWGLPLATAFLVGAVIAQSSTTVIGKQLAEQGEEHARHGRMGISMSVFQDVTAVPLLVIIPVLAGAVSEPLWLPLGTALVKAVVAFAIVFAAGRWLLGPLFHEIAARRSPELFTMTVLLVTLLAAGLTDLLGLSMALGAFLAGMMLGETAFRHQIESTIRPFRDVLLGLFFITIGMLLDVSALPGIWHLAAIGAVAFVAFKFVLVLLIVRLAGIERMTAARIAVILAIGGEFGFALLAIGLSEGAIAEPQAQVLLTAVLFSIIAAPLLIRANGRIARMLFAEPVARSEAVPVAATAPPGQRDHVIICGYGRIGQNVARFLKEEGVPFVALDLDPERVRDAHAAAMPVFYGDASERDILDAVGAARARLVVVSHEDPGATRKLLHQVGAAWPGLQVMVRTRDEGPVDELLALGATEVVPETLEAGMMIAAHALLLAGVAPVRVVRRVREAQANRYQLLRELHRADDPLSGESEGAPDAERLHSFRLSEGIGATGRRIEELDLAGCVVKALVRDGVREADPSPRTRLQAGDTLVLFGTPDALEQCESLLLQTPSPST